MNIQVVALEARKSFNGVAGKPDKAKPTRPFAIRFTDDELAYLRNKVGGLPLGTYCRQELLGSNVDKSRKQRQPKVDQKEIAALLAGLGKSRLPSNLNQLAKAANTGTLDVSEEVEQQLQDAYAAVIAMREALFMALGLRSS